MRLCPATDLMNLKKAEEAFTGGSSLQRTFKFPETLAIKKQH